MPDSDYEARWGKGPHLTVDAFVHWKRHALLIRRKDNNMWALPGGFVEPGERLAEAAIRELIEETKIKAQSTDDTIELVQVFIQDAPDRDPRSHIVTVVHVFDITGGVPYIEPADDAADARFFSFAELFRKITAKQLYADHGDSILKAISCINDIELDDE